METTNKRIAKNTLLLYIRMLFALIVSLYTSRVILKTLGVDDYGIYNVVAGFVSMFGFFNATLSSSMQRFYNYEGAQRGIDGYNDVYRTGLLIHIILAVFLLLLLETVGLWYVNSIMVISEGRLFAANMVYQSTVFSMLLIVCQIPYLGAIMADERMDYYAIISVADVVLKLLAVLVLPLVPYDALITYSVLLLFISVFDFLAYFVYAKSKILKDKMMVKYISRNINKSLFNSILGFSGWNLLGSFAFLLKGQGLNMILNVFWGPVVNAARGIAMQVNGGVAGLTGSIPVAFRPQIVSSYASCEKDRCVRLMFIESKVCYYMVLILIIPIILEMDYILHLWLGDVIPDGTGVFTILVLIDALICTLNTPMTQVAFATGDIKFYQICSSCVNIFLLPVGFVLLKIGLKAESVFIATIVFSLFNNAACLYALRRLFDFSIKRYLFEVLSPCLLLSLALPVLPFLFWNLLDAGTTRFLVTCISVCLWGIPIVFFLGFSKAEQYTLLQFVKLDKYFQKK